MQCPFPLDVEGSVLDPSVSCTSRHPVHTVMHADLGYCCGHIAYLYSNEFFEVKTMNTIEESNAEV